MEWEEIAELRGQEIARLHRCCRKYDREVAELREKLAALEAYSAQPTEGMSGKFSVESCVEREVDGERWIECPDEGEDAMFWGVYAINLEGLAMHVADFNDKSDAEFFARCKEAVYA